MEHWTRKRWRRWVWRVVLFIGLGVGSTYGTAAVSHYIPYRFVDWKTYHFPHHGHWWRVYEVTHGWRHYIIWSCHLSPARADIEEARQFLLERNWMKSVSESTGSGTVNTHFIDVEPPTLGFREFIESGILTGPATYHTENGMPMIWPKRSGIELEAGWPMRGLKGASVGLKPGTPPVAIRGGVHLGGPYSRFAPLIPVLPGFIINTLFYAALWGSVIFGSRGAWRGAIRWRRRRRGACPMCAYDLAGQVESGCSECGWGRTKPHVSSLAGASQ